MTSAYLRYVSIDATVTRASIVIRSIPTSDTRTQASITMPLSSTRSSTSMRLLAAEARSTFICTTRRVDRSQLQAGMPNVVLSRGRVLPTPRAGHGAGPGCRRGGRGVRRQRRAAALARRDAPHSLVEPELEVHPAAALLADRSDASRRLHLSRGWRRVGRACLGRLRRPAGARG